MALVNVRTRDPARRHQPRRPRGGRPRRTRSTSTARVFEFELRGRRRAMAFLDMGDQFLVLAEGRTQAPDGARHFGLVVDDRERDARAPRGGRRRAARRRAASTSATPGATTSQVVEYSRHPVLQDPGGARRDGPRRLEKTPAALEELREKGLALARSSVAAACSSVGATTGQDWPIAFGLPGKFTISVRPRTPDTPRVRMPSGVCSRESARIASA